MENIAAVLHGPSRIEIESWPVEEPEAGEIQVKVHSVGVCGTDIHYWRSGALFDQPLTEPMVIGHETAAEVIKIGPGVINFKPGDRVHLNPAPACHLCKCCLAGNEHNCQKIKLGKLFHGHIRRVCNHPAEFTIKIPENLSMDVGALIEPWVVGVYAVERAALKPGQSCAIIGAGAIGYMVCLAANLAGASRICVADIAQPKLDLVEKVSAGSCKTLLVDRDPKKTAGKIEDVLGEKPDIVFDATCTQPGITTAIYTAAPCGKVILAGLAPESCTLPMQHAAINEIDLINVVRYGHCYPKALSLLECGKVDLAPLVASRFPLEKTQQALEATASGLTTGFKTIVDCTI